MQNDSYESSARVRHVPIHIESRDHTPKGARTGQSSASHQYPSRQSTQRGNGAQSNGCHDQGRESQDSTSININHKPELPKRNPDKFQQFFQTQPKADVFSERPSRFPSEGTPMELDREEIYQAAEKPFTRAPRDETDVPQRESTGPKEEAVKSDQPIPLPPPPSDHRTPTPETNDQLAGEKAEEGTRQKSNHTNNCNIPKKKSDPTPSEKFEEVRKKITDLLPAIQQFNGKSPKSKEYRYLDEMLTRCVLELDGVQCGDSDELRKQRKAIVKLVDKATDILQRKQQLNSDMDDLSETIANQFQTPN